MLYDKEIIENKVNEIKEDALNNLKKGLKIKPFALTSKELKIISEAEKINLRLVVYYKGESYRIPVIKMRF